MRSIKAAKHQKASASTPNASLLASCPPSATALRITNLQAQPAKGQGRWSSILKVARVFSCRPEPEVYQLLEQGGGGQRSVQPWRRHPQSSATGGTMTAP